MKTFFGFVAIILGIGLFLSFCFGIHLGSLKWDGFFAKEKANIERQVYEESKSYTHGKAQALAKYYQEYKAAEPEDRVIITNVIRMEFGTFDENKLTNTTLKSFLISVRGY